MLLWRLTPGQGFDTIIQLEKGDIGEDLIYCTKLKDDLKDLYIDLITPH